MRGERISLWAALWVVYLAGERVPGGTVLAAVVGLVGLAFVVGPDGLGGGSVAVGPLVMLAASLSWSRGSFVSRRLSLPADPFVATVYECWAVASCSSPRPARRVRQAGSTR